ncbi:CLUMA_CG002919, isoform A [Clunio marinus]|uniref:CLUMA_CG002919, isoform A n=1 Tax=Clunio marinus TaxID=568069 RepID=A0A1J1HRQ5_9DIPT|nr:CLUMA_CG002919, isoform A [Clunio marinus]
MKIDFIYESLSCILCLNVCSIGFSCGDVMFKAAKALTIPTILNSDDFKSLALVGNEMMSSLICQRQTT